MATTEFHEWLQDTLDKNPDISDGELAHRVLELGDEEVIFQALVWFIQGQRTTLSNRAIRESVRSERQANMAADSEQATPAAPIAFDSLALRRGVLEARKIVPGVGYVAIGEMTVEHHQARITELARTRDGIDRNIELHRAAIAEIEKAGVSCLNEIVAVPA